MRGMLVRIPDDWGRWISCSRGWYPLLVELDEQLRELLPNYELHQVKEKYGGLRYYWESGEEIHDPRRPAAPHTRTLAVVQDALPRLRRARGIPPLRRLATCPG
jgi:hypothetical protein